MIENPGLPEEAMLEKVQHELATTQKQRAMLGEIAGHWISRFYALKVANGDMPAGNLMDMIERDLRQIDAIMQGIANG